MASPFPSRESIEDAAARIKPHVKHTPVLSSESLNQHTGAQLFFKCENFQRVGAFKFRGALNAVLSLSNKEVAHGIITHSSGNHAQAVALAARLRGIPAYIVMPENAQEVKKRAVAAYGGMITYCNPMQEERENAMEKLRKKTGATLIHPYNDTRVIAGQATAAMELFEEINDLDYLLVPVGGGGLLSGTALSTYTWSPETKVIGTEPKAANDAFLSFQKKRLIPSVNPKTVADGLLTSLGNITFDIMLKHVHQILTTSEINILTSMKLIWERMKIIIEPSAAVPFSAMNENKALFVGKRVGIILSGGNVDIDNKLPWHHSEKV